MVSCWLSPSILALTLLSPLSPYLSFCLSSFIILEHSLTSAFVGLIRPTYALNLQLSYLTTQMGAYIFGAIFTCFTHVASTDVRTDRVTLKVCFPLVKYFCGEAILLLGFCGRGVCFWAHQSECSLLILACRRRRRRGKNGQHLEKNGDQRSERWRKITAGWYQCKWRRNEKTEEHGGKGQEVKGIVGGESVLQSTVRGRGGWMTNEVRESGGNEINFSSSKADWRKSSCAATLYNKAEKYHSDQWGESGPKAPRIPFF